jgi:hypothetical protein
VSPLEPARESITRHTFVNRIRFDASCRVLKKTVQQGRSE